MRDVVTGAVTAINRISEGIETAERPAEMFAITYMILLIIAQPYDS